MAGLYRSTALEKISSPEQLDKAIRVTNPMSWIALVGVTVIVVITVIWSIIGSIPETVSSVGIISSPVGTNAIYTGDSGKVVAVLVREGSEVHIGDAVLSYQNSEREVKTVYSDQAGTIDRILVKNGDDITQGNEVVRVSPISLGSQVAVAYVPIGKANKIERGMQVQVYMDSVDSQSKGHMVARVVNVDSRATSATGMNYVLGSDNNLASSFQRDGAVVAVACEFYPDETASGYYWSNEKGKEIVVPNGSTITVKIVTEEVAPISKLFSKLKEIWGE